MKNYVPVTDAMLRNPDPADWLMIRRDYKASYYSPLNQITTQNVNDLRQVWSWAMQDGSPLGNDPAPIVHNGVLYVNNAGLVLQALDAKTGELIWENRYGTNAGSPAMRGIAIYGDNVYVTSSEAHLIAFDARNGKVRLGYHHRRSLQGPALHHQRTDCRERQADPGSERLPAVWRREMLYQRLRCQDRQRSVALRTIALKGEPGGDTWGGLPTLLAWARKPGSPAATIPT